MRQITYGEIHKKNIKTCVNLDIDTNNIFSKQKDIYESLKNKNILYENGKLLNKLFPNYLYERDDNLSKHFKAIITNEFNECENVYPFLGNYFLEKLFNQNFKSFKSLNTIDKNKIFKILKEESLESIKDIFQCFLMNASMQYFVSIHNNKTGSDIIIEKTNDCIFDNQFDIDFFPLKENIFYNFNTCIIDGFIDSVGEIHHLLQDSTDNKNKTYVIFCYGMSPDVKKTIMVNNARKNTRIFPISFELKEENLNILNDISIVLNTEIISSQKGQTISTALRKNLKQAKKIVINKNKVNFLLKPECEEIVLNKHRDFLNNKINSLLNNDINKNLILKRIKSVSSKNLNIFLPDDLMSNSFFNKKLNYYFSLLSKCNNTFNKKILQNNVFYFPKNYCDWVDKKVASVKKAIKEINVVIEEEPCQELSI